MNASGGGTRAVDPGAADSTVIYEAEFFNQYNPITASDMLDQRYLELTFLAAIGVVEATAVWAPEVTF